jgi:autotransporter passenger strand-loop-strand repeat protein
MLAGGTADETTVEQNAKLDIDAGGVTHNTVINDGGKQTNDGTEYNTTLSVGAFDRVTGSAVSPVILDGATLDDFGGKVVNPIIDDGSEAAVESGDEIDEGSAHDGKITIGYGGFVFGTDFDNAGDLVDSGTAQSATFSQGASEQVAIRFPRQPAKRKGPRMRTSIGLLGHFANVAILPPAKFAFVDLV